MPSTIICIRPNGISDDSKKSSKTSENARKEKNAKPSKASPVRSNPSSGKPKMAPLPATLRSSSLSAGAGGPAEAGPPGHHFTLAPTTLSQFVLISFLAASCSSSVGKTALA